MKFKEGTREQRIQARIEKLTNRALEAETKIDNLQKRSLKIEGNVHKMYVPLIRLVHRLYSIPSQGDKTMIKILDLIDEIEVNKNKWSQIK